METGRRAGLLHSAGVVDRARSWTDRTGYRWGGVRVTITTKKYKQKKEGHGDDAPVAVAAEDIKRRGMKWSRRTSKTGRGSQKKNESKRQQ